MYGRAAVETPGEIQNSIVIHGNKQILIELSTVYSEDKQMEVRNHLSSSFQDLLIRIRSLIKSWIIYTVG